MADHPSYPLTGEFELHWHQISPQEWEAEIVDRRTGHRDRVRHIRQLKAFLNRSLTPALDDPELR